MKLTSTLVGAASMLAVAATTNAALVYGGASQTASRFNPGAGAITYMNCFVDTSSGGTQLQLDNVAVGIRRLVNGAGALVNVGMNIHVAQMTYDGVNYGRGTDTIIFSSAGIGAGAATITQTVSQATNMLVNLEMVSNGPNLGGLWIGVEFTGANAADASNGWRVVNGDMTAGASINAFGLFNNAGSGIFQSFFAFGTPPGSSPSRFMVDLNGSVVPAPGALALLSLAGMVGGRRRRSVSL